MKTLVPFPRTRIETALMLILHCCPFCLSFHKIQLALAFFFLLCVFSMQKERHLGADTLAEWSHILRVLIWRLFLSRRVGKSELCPGGWKCLPVCGGKIRDWSDFYFPLQQCIGFLMPSQPLPWPPVLLNTWPKVLIFNGLITKWKIGRGLAWFMQGPFRRWDGIYVIWSTNDLVY